MSGMTQIPGSKIQTQWIKVTPQMAEDFLNKNLDNRTLRNRNLQRMTSDMTNDRWQTIHQGLAFDENDLLIDGQHRLVSIINSGKPQWLLVTTGLNPDAKKIVDTQATRTATTFMKSKYRTTQGAVIRNMLCLERMNFTFSPNQLRMMGMSVTNAEIQESWDKYGDLDELLVKATAAGKNTVGIGASSHATAALVYPETAEEFLAGLISMEGLTKGDARLTLLRYTGKLIRGNSQVTTGAFLSIKAAKNFAEGNRLPMLRASNTEVLRCFPLKKKEVTI